MQYFDKADFIATKLSSTLLLTMTSTENFSIENIEKAVVEFYSGCQGNIQRQNVVNKFLMQAQISKEAWTFPWAMLSPEKSIPVQYFAATSIYTKVSRFFHELSDQDVGPLRDEILHRIVVHASGPHNVLNRLCVAIVSLALQTTPHIWPRIISSFMENFNQSKLPNLSASKVCCILLEILTVLPEEFGVSHYVKVKKKQVADEIEKDLPRVMELIQSLLTDNSSPPEVVRQALHCFTSWMTYGVPIPTSEPLIILAFQALHKEEYFEVAVEGLQAAFDHPEIDRYYKTVMGLLPNVLTLQSMWKRALEDKDEDCVLTSLTKLLTFVAESVVSILVKAVSLGPPDADAALQLIQMVLICSSVQGTFPVDESFSDIPQVFWYTLQDTVLECANLSPFLPVTFAPIYMTLVSTMIYKIRYPSDASLKSWTEDDKDKFRCYRIDMTDGLSYFYSLLGNSILHVLLAFLNDQIQRINRKEHVTWQETESILYCLSGISSACDMEDNVLIPTLFELLKAVPLTRSDPRGQAHDEVIQSALMCIASYGEWLVTHAQVYDFVIPLILECLPFPSLGECASLSLRDIAQEGLPHMAPFATVILKALQHVFEDKPIKGRDMTRLMGTAGLMLSVMDKDEMMLYLNTLLSPHLSQLQQLSQQQCCPSVKESLLLELEMFSFLVGTFNIYWDCETLEDHEERPERGPQPVIFIVQELYPVIESILQKWMMDEAIVEEICNMFKRTVQNLMSDFSPLYKCTATLISTLYQAHPLPALLDLTRTCILLFYADAEYVETNQQLLHCVLTVTLQLYDNQTIFMLPDVHESFMYCLFQVCKKMSRVLVGCGVPINALVRAAVISLQMNETVILKNAQSFLVELVRACADEPAISQAIGEYGETLVDIILRAIGGGRPRELTTQLSELLCSLSQCCRPQFDQWLSKLLEQEAYPNPTATGEQKQRFYQKLAKDRVSKQRTKELVTEFTLIWRGLYGTEYARQTTHRGI